MVSPLTPLCKINYIVGRRHQRSSLSLIAYLALAASQKACQAVAKPCHPVPSRCPRFVSAAAPPTIPTTMMSATSPKAIFRSDIRRASGGGGQRVPCAPVHATGDETGLGADSPGDCPPPIQTIQLRVPAHKC